MTPSSSAVPVAATVTPMPRSSAATRAIALRVASLAGPAADAEDAVQEAFVKAYRSLPKVRRGPAVPPVAARDRGERGAQPGPLGAARDGARRPGRGLRRRGRRDRVGRGVGALRASARGRSPLRSPPCAPTSRRCSSAGSCSTWARTRRRRRSACAAAPSSRARRGRSRACGSPCRREPRERPGPHPRAARPRPPARRRAGRRRGAGRARAHRRAGTRTAGVACGRWCWRSSCCWCSRRRPWPRRTAARVAAGSSVKIERVETLPPTVSTAATRRGAPRRSPGLGLGTPVDAAAAETALGARCRPAPSSAPRRPSIAPPRPTATRSRWPGRPPTPCC